MIFPPGTLIEGVWRTLIEAEISEQSLAYAEVLRYGTGTLAVATESMEHRRLIEEMITDPVVRPYTNYRVDNIEGVVPEGGKWGPKASHDDPVAKRLTNALPKDYGFVIAFYTRTLREKAIDCVVHGKVSTIQFELIHDSIDQLLGLNHERIEEARAQKYTR